MRPLLPALLAVLLLVACGQQRGGRAVAACDLSSFRFATVVFIGHDALQDQAISELKSLGLLIIAETDPHLQDAGVRAHTLDFRFEIVHDVNGPALELVVHDRSGAERFEVKRKRPDFGLALHDAINAFSPCHPAPSSNGAPGAPVEL
jgi:hypothetical protein